MPNLSNNVRVDYSIFGTTYTVCGCGPYLGALAQLLSLDPQKRPKSAHRPGQGVHNSANVYLPQFGHHHSLTSSPFQRTQNVQRLFQKPAIAVEGVTRIEQNPTD